MTITRRAFYFLTGLFAAGAFVVTIGQGFGGGGFGSGGGGGASISDAAYDATGWDGVTTVAPSKNAVRDVIEGISAGAFTWDSIGDPSGNGTIAFASTAQDITSTNDDAGEYVLRITNTDADQANDVSFIWLRHNDGADANVQYLRATGDTDGTPTTDILITQTEAMFEMPLGLGAAGVLITDDGDGAITLLGRGNGSDEDLTFNFDDTANEVDVTTSTGVLTIQFNSIDLVVPTEVYGAGWDGDNSVPTKDAVFDKIEAISAGATAYDDVGDPDANSSIAFAGFTNIWTSTLDNGIVFEITNTDADAAADTILLKLSHDDGADANVIFLQLIGDKDGTPATAFQVSETAALFGVALTVVDEAYDDTGWNGNLTAPTKNAIRDYIAGSILPIGADPGGDFILFWDESDNAIDYLTTNDCLTISGNTLTLATTCDAIVNSVSLEAAGVKISGDDDGAITFLGLGNGNDEDLTLNLDDTANTVVLSSSTGLNVWDFGGFSLLNTVLDCEATGNSCAGRKLYEWKAAVSQATVASVGLNLRSTNPCAGADSGQQDAPFAACDFDAATDEFANFDFGLPSDFNASGQVDVIIHWYADSTSTNAARFCSNTTSKAAGESVASFTFDNETCVDAANTGTTANLLNVSTISNIDISDWAASERAFVLFSRDANHANDNLAADGRVVAVFVVWRYAQ